MTILGLDERATLHPVRIAQTAHTWRRYTETAKDACLDTLQKCLVFRTLKPGHADAVSENGQHDVFCPAAGTNSLEDRNMLLALGEDFKVWISEGHRRCVLQLPMTNPHAQLPVVLSLQTSLSSKYVRDGNHHVLDRGDVEDNACVPAQAVMKQIRILLFHCRTPTMLEH